MKKCIHMTARVKLAIEKCQICICQFSIIGIIGRTQLTTLKYLQNITYFVKKNGRSVVLFQIKCYQTF